MMTNLLTRSAAIATLATILLGTVLGAQAEAAGRFVPPPTRNTGGADTTYQNRGRCDAAQLAQIIADGIRQAGYVQTYNHKIIRHENKYWGIGVKSNDRWFAFRFDMCSGELSSETPLPGRPSNL